jgi:hypothetical protein
MSHSVQPSQVNQRDGDAAGQSVAEQTEELHQGLVDICFKVQHPYIQHIQLYELGAACTLKILNWLVVWNIFYFSIYWE